MAAALTPRTLRCEYLVNPLGIDTQRPRLGWTLAAEGRAQSQSAYRILVAGSPEALSAGRANLWDSGRVESNRTSHIEYGGRELRARERAWWTVQVWDQDRQPGESGETAWWERGLEHDDWHGQWIGLDNWNGLHLPATLPPGVQPDPDAPLAGLIPSPYLRTTVPIEGKVRRARVHATAKGLYELWINGARVGDQLLTPGWTDYDRRIQYQTYDITDFLRPGENVLGSILAPGWYAGYIGFGDHCRHYGSRPQLLLECGIEYEDGRLQVLASDDTWRASTGPIKYGDLLTGEYYDARAELPGWDEPGYDDSAWQAVAAVPRTAVRLVADLAEPIHIVHELTPIGVAEPSPGVYVVDLGQNIAGWVRLRVQGPVGTRIQLRYAEILTPDGMLYVENLRAARATDTYVLSDAGKQTYEPRFTFHGFRYVEVTGYPGPLGAESIVGCAVASNTPSAGASHCSSDLINQLQRNIEWGQRGNFLSVPTDCPQRDERLGWLGGAQSFIGTACCNADVAAFFTKWMVDVEDAQSPAGGFPNVAPRLGSLADGAPAWADAGVIVPWTIYRRYGDTTMIRRHYAAMTRYMDYLRQANPGYLRIGRLNNNFGDWLSIDADTPSDVLATAYWAYDARLMAEMAAVTGESDDAQRYADLFERIKTAFNDAYVDGEGRGGHLSTGVIGVGYLCPVLTEAGRLDVAYRLLTNETFPSWGYSIREGATTIWERWDGYTQEHGFQTPEMNSFNHYALGSVGDWLYRYVAGIAGDSERPRYARIVIRPYPGGELSFVEATYRSLHGPIACAWRIEKGTFTLEVTIPANTTATVYLPTNEPAGVRESDRPVGEAEGVRLVGHEGDRAVLSIGSGTYRFTADLVTA